MRGRFLYRVFSVSSVDSVVFLARNTKQVRAKPGWLFLIGTKDNVSIVIKKLGLYVEDKESHSTLLLIGNDSTGLWKKAFGLAKPDDVIPVVRSVL